MHACPAAFESVRSVSPAVRICLTDPCGAALVRHFTHGELKGEGSSISEGIGQGRITGNVGHDGFEPDLCLEVTDDEMMQAIIDLQLRDGLGHAWRRLEAISSILSDLCKKRRLSAHQFYF